MYRRISNEIYISIYACEWKAFGGFQACRLLHVKLEKSVSLEKTHHSQWSQQPLPELWFGLSVFSNANARVMSNTVDVIPFRVLPEFQPIIRVSSPVFIWFVSFHLQPVSTDQNVCWIAAKEQFFFFPRIPLFLHRRFVGSRSWKGTFTAGNLRPPSSLPTRRISVHVFPWKNFPTELGTPFLLCQYGKITFLWNKKGGRGLPRRAWGFCNEWILSHVTNCSGNQFVALPKQLWDSHTWQS